MTTPERAGPDADFPAILALIQASFAFMEGRIDPPSSMRRLTPESVARHAAEQELWLIRESGRPVACVFLTRHPDKLYLGKLAVNAAHRGKGYSRILVEQAAERAAALGLPALELQSRIELVENHRLFERLGFARTAETAHPGYDRPTSVTMRRPVRRVALSRPLA